MRAKSYIKIFNLYTKHIHCAYCFYRLTVSHRDTFHKYPWFNSIILHVYVMETTMVVRCAIWALCKNLSFCVL